VEKSRKSNPEIDKQKEKGKMGIPARVKKPARKNMLKKSDLKKKQNETGARPESWQITAGKSA